MADRKKLEFIIEKIVKEEMNSYPSVLGQITPFIPHKTMFQTGFGNEPLHITPKDFQGKLDLYDGVDKLFYHFSVPSIIEAMAEHIKTKAMAVKNDMEEHEELLNIAGELKSMVNRMKV